MRKNCWDAKQCECQKGGKGAVDVGACPASQEKRLDGVHGGKNAGRACWAVAGTLSAKKICGVYAKQIESCVKCEFYLKTRLEERSQFIPVLAILNKLKD